MRTSLPTRKPQPKHGRKLKRTQPARRRSRPISSGAYASCRARRRDMPAPALERFQGRIKFFNASKAHGFIAPDELVQPELFLVFPKPPTKTSRAKTMPAPMRSERITTDDRRQPPLY